MKARALQHVYKEPTMPLFTTSAVTGYQTSGAGSTQPVQRLGYRLENTGFDFQGR